MPVTTPPALSAIPAFPALSERAAGTYNANAYACLNHWAATGGPQLAALADNVFDNATEAAAAAAAVGAQVETATTQAGIASAAAIAADARADAAALSEAAASASAVASDASADAAALSQAAAHDSELAAAASAASIAGGPVASVNGMTGVVTGLATASDITSERSAAAILTNKTLALGNNTISGTLAQFNAAVTDADIASLAGTETLLNKTINIANNTLIGVQPTLVSGSNIKTVGGATLLGSGDISVSTRTPVWTAITATGTYTVPSGVTSIRAYAFGKGGNGFASTSGAAAGGGGGGCAYGDIAVTAGQSVSISISGGVATLSIGGTTYLTANPGSNATSGTGAAGGSASKHASVTNGGAYSGGTSESAIYGGGGASSGSPLGSGFGSTSVGHPSGGGGWGGTGSYAGGGGAGGNASGWMPGGAGGSASDFSSVYTRMGGVGRSIPNLFTDPLMVGLTAPGVGYLDTSGYNQIPSHGGPGAGGAGLNFSNSSVACYAANGGTGGGGGGIRGGGTSQTLYGGAGGFGGGGGGAWGGSGSTCIGGNGGYGGGGGGAAGSVSSATAGTGGAAIVLIYA